MCYEIAAQTYSRLKYARRVGASQEEIERLEREYERLKPYPLYYAMSFAFPKLVIYRNTDPKNPVLAEFSLIPHFAKTKKEADRYRAQYRTANATVEKVRTTPMYRGVVSRKWCFILLDGFFENHHHNKKSHPFHIRHKSTEPILMPGLWDEWVDPETGEVRTSCNILTRAADGFMEVLHNKKTGRGPRMPIMIKPGLEAEILNDFDLVLDNYKEIELPLDELEFFPVGQLRGSKNGIGNKPEAWESHEYDTLKGSTILEFSKS